MVRVLGGVLARLSALCIFSGTLCAVAGGYAYGDVSPPFLSASAGIDFPSPYASCARTFLVLGTGVAVCVAAAAMAARLCSTAGCVAAVCGCVQLVVAIEFPAHESPRTHIVSAALGFACVGAFVCEFTLLCSAQQRARGLRPKLALEIPAASATSSLLVCVGAGMVGAEERRWVAVAAAAELAYICFIVLWMLAAARVLDRRPARLQQSGEDPGHGMSEEGEPAVQQPQRVGYVVV